MTTIEVADIFRNYCDESDATFLDDAQVANYLNIGYNQFRKIVTEQDNNFYYRSVVITPSTSSYDLAASTNPVRIMGEFPTDLPMYRLLRVSYSSGIFNTNNNQPIYLKPGRSTVDVLAGINMYVLLGSQILFSNNVDGNILIEYIPKALINTGLAPAPPAPVGTILTDPIFTVASITTTPRFIDDLSEYHDIIALLAYRQYAIKDFASNPVLETHRTERMEDLKDYLASGFSWTARTFVIGSDEDDYII